MTADFVHPEDLGESIHLMVKQAESGIQGILDPRLTRAATNILDSPDALEDRQVRDGVSARGYPDQRSVVFMNAYQDTLIVRVTPAWRRHAAATPDDTITLVSVCAPGPEQCQQVFVYQPPTRSRSAGEVPTT